MSKITEETIRLLDKVYNYRSPESTILFKIDEDMEKAVNYYQETSLIHQELQDTINKLNSDVEVLTKQGEKMDNILKSFNEEDYSKLIDTLRIDFHPLEIKEKINSLLPITLSGLNNDIKMSSNEFSRITDKLAETKTQMEELNIRKEEALVNQSRLNNYFEMALNSGIDATREELTSLFNSFDLTEDEARECAKLLLFPEDGLYEYEKDYKNRVINKPVFEEKNDNLDEQFVVEQIETEDSPITFIDENMLISEEQLEAPVAEEITPINIEENSVVESNNTVMSKEEVINYLTNQGFDQLDFTSNDIDILMNNFNEEIITNNIKYIKDLGVNIDVFVDNIRLLFDKDLKSKVDKLMNLGKLPQDIYLNPNVLSKYNLIELDNAIKELEDSGLEPKNVPLMAY